MQFCERGLRPVAIPAVRLRARLDEASAAPPAVTGLRGGWSKVPLWGLAAAVVILAIGLSMILRSGSQQTSPSGLQETVPRTNQETPMPVAPAAIAADVSDSPHRSRQVTPPPDPVVTRPPKRERRSTVESETTRHLQQTQQLLRSIRNAEAETGDWAYDLQISRELLNRNRLLRRSAVQKQDAVAERMLVHVEPILLDISNLSEQPAPDEIDSVKAMIREQSIINEIRLYAARARS